jgi:hypothetical protein
VSEGEQYFVRVTEVSDPLPVEDPELFSGQKTHSTLIDDADVNLTSV